LPLNYYLLTRLIIIALKIHLPLVLHVHTLEEDDGGNPRKSVADRFFDQNTGRQRADDGNNNKNNNNNDEDGDAKTDDGAWWQQQCDWATVSKK